MFSDVNRILACDRQMDKQTDILRQHSLRYAYASHGNKARPHSSVPWKHQVGTTAPCISDVHAAVNH